MKLIRFGLLSLVFAAAPAMATDTSILQKDQQFMLTSITINAGDLVRWGNADPFNHNISIKGDGVDADLGLQKPREILAYKFEQAGVYSVICHIHPRMKMSVTVR